MSEFVSSVASKLFPSIPKNSVPIFATLGSLLFWTTHVTKIRNLISSLLTYFDWEVDWYQFIVGFSGLPVIQYIFIITLFMSMFHVLIHPWFLGRSTVWLVFSITFLELGAGWSLWKFIGAAIFIIVISGIYYGVESKFNFVEFLEDILACLLKVIIVLLFPIFFLWSIISEKGYKGEQAD